MECKTMKQIRLTILERNFARTDWMYDFEGSGFQSFYETLAKDMNKMGVDLELVWNRNATITINSYADLLNVVKLSALDEGHNNHCIGHIIGKSQNLDIQEDIRIAVRRIAFAPETIAPSGEFRKVCHNCGCGC
ncbi:MAG: hypothetical protein RW306_01425 [Geobacteraceae bacterium]|nr:hypothetical protein [Geobacteraceae bacterium]